MALQYCNNFCKISFPSSGGGVGEHFSKVHFYLPVILKQELGRTINLPF